MEHPDTAQLAAIGGALGSVLVLLARGRGALLAGPGGARRCRGRAGPLAGRRDRSTSWASAAGAGAALIGPGRAGRGRGGAGRAGPRWCRWRCWWRRPSGRRSTSTARTALLVSVADDGRLGRLLPLYFVLAAAGAALGWRALRGHELRAAAAPDRPAGGGLLRLCLLLAGLGRRPGGGHQPAGVLHPALRRPGGHRGPGGLPRERAPDAGRHRHRARLAVRNGGAVAGGDPRGLLLRAQPRRVQREHGLLPGHLAVRRSEPVRAPPGAGDRRGAGAARGAPLACLAVDRRAGRHVAGAAVLLLPIEHGGAARGHARARPGHRHAPGAAWPWGCWPWRPHWPRARTWPCR